MNKSSSETYNVGSSGVAKAYSKLIERTLAPPQKGEEEFDDIISDSTQYGRIQFWELKYASEHEPFEWYYGYSAFRETIREYVPLNSKVMMAGCGSSNMLGDMADDGYEDLVGADLSRVVITQLKYRYQKYPNISFFQGNMTDTDLPENSVGAVIDKGLFDALLCTATGSTTVAQYINEVERILTEIGVFIIISYGNPQQRLHFLEQHDLDEPYYTPWTIEVQALLKPKEFPEEELDSADPNSYYFVYICEKRRDMVLRKRIKLGRLTKKEQKKYAPKSKKAPNLKPMAL